jgi:hypothetical protein
MYGLPDSAIIGTAKRLRGKRRRKSYADPYQEGGGFLLSLVAFIAFLISPREVLDILQEDEVRSTKKQK